MDKSDKETNLHKADQVYFLYDPQPVRLLDVIYVGPIMIYAGVKGKNLNPFVKWSLIGVGICTIIYNGANFYINEKRAYERKKLAKEEAERQRLEELQSKIAEAERVYAEKMAAKENKTVLSDEVIEAMYDTESVPKGEMVESGEVDTTIESTIIDLPAEVADLINNPFDKEENGSPIVKKKQGRPKKVAPSYSQNGQTNH